MTRASKAGHTKNKLRFLSVNEENRFSANLGIVGVCLLRLIMADFLGELLDKNIFKLHDK